PTRTQALHAKEPTLLTRRVGSNQPLSKMNDKTFIQPSPHRPRHLPTSSTSGYQHHNRRSRSSDEAVPCCWP
ncbi:hypothetical protein, partial [Bacteroides heparinolyticus]|uniref:hypothetical protein n=1 Tax=Prevotella heparinolytica TaxID=28113 RepID=UPI0035A187A2